MSVDAEFRAVQFATHVKINVIAQIVSAIVFVKNVMMKDVVNVVATLHVAQPVTHAKINVIAQIVSVTVNVKIVTMKVVQNVIPVTAIAPIVTIQDAVNVAIAEILIASLVMETSKK